MNLNKQYGIGLSLVVVTMALVGVSPVWAVVTGFAGVLTLIDVIRRVL